MKRREELISIICKDGSGDEVMLTRLIDELLFVEDQLTALKKLPFIKTHPQNPEMQKATPAAKQYKELLQQYTNIIKVLERTAGDDGTEEESPLRKWVRNHADN